MVDLGAERVIAAEKEEQKIAVEIKSFVSFSILQAFHEAVGQYRNYDSVLSKEETERHLFLAVSKDTYDIFTQTSFFRDRLLEEEIRLLVFDSEQNEIVQWIH